MINSLGKPLKIDCDYFLLSMVKKTLITLILFCSYILPALAQDTTYYDANWKVSVAANASYFRLKLKKTTGWQVKDCYISGKPQMEGAYSDDSCTINQGLFSYYDEKGHLYHLCHYEQGQLEGDEILYYDNNQIRTEGKYKDGHRDGDWVGYYPSGKLSARSSFKDGDQISGDFFNEDGTRNESVNEFSKANSYPGGSRALQRFLIRNLNYPGTAVNRSIEGTVLIGFNISKAGKIENIKLLKSVETSLDKEALRVVGLIPEWEPLIIGGILCDSYQRQPIIFSLQER